MLDSAGSGTGCGLISAREESDPDPIDLTASRARRKPNLDWDAARWHRRFPARIDLRHR